MTVVMRRHVTLARTMAPDARAGTIPRGVSIRMAQNCIDALPNGFGHRDAAAACEFLQPAMLGRLQLDLRLDHMMPPFQAIIISPREYHLNRHPHYRAN